MHVNYGITVGLGVHKNWNNFNLKLSELLQACLFSQKLKFYISRQVGNYYLWDGREGNLNFFYCMVNTNTPNYLCILTVPTIQSTSVYPLRNGNDIILPFCRLSSTRNYFISSTIKMCNMIKWHYSKCWFHIKI
jgi:hypothetical protein